MKYGLFSDIHSNLEAFQAVLDALRKEGVDRYVFLGDIVGYGADPVACLQILRDLIRTNSCQSVAGNHDYVVCEKSLADNFNRYARDAVDWTKRKIENSDKNFLSQMKLVQKIEGFTIAHAALRFPEKWGYILDIDDAQPNFHLLENQICFVGHSHRPVVFLKKEIIDWSLDEKILIQKDVKYIINIGSVGQPRDGNPQACFAIYDTDRKLVEIKRVAYDIKKAQKKIIEAGLPSILAERLSLGK